LDAARAMLGRSGISGLRLRAVAQRAGVNLGMFHYHFKSKEAFVRRLLQDVYEEFFSRLSLEFKGRDEPLERLQRSLIVFGKFARDQRTIFVSLLSEALRGHRSSIDYLQKNIPRHVHVIAELVQECEKSGTLKALPVPVAVSFAVGGMGVPNLMITALERSGSSQARQFLSKWADEFVSDRAIERRADLILAALKT
jgi:AcrR family transcriptional regulator